MILFRHTKKNRKSNSRGVLKPITLPPGKKCHKLVSPMFCIQDILHNSEGSGDEDCAEHRPRDSPQMLPLELSLHGAVAALAPAEPVLNVTASQEETYLIKTLPLARRPLSEWLQGTKISSGGSGWQEEKVEACYPRSSLSPWKRQAG